MNGKQLDTLIRNTFQLSKDAPITVAQANHVIQMLKPTNYLLAHHKIRGKPVTYTVPNYDTTKALMHRPQQIDILNDLSHEVTIMKGRQLGLSEVGVAQAIYFADTHSFDKVNILYTFPTYTQLNDFYKQRISPEFDDGYYATLVDKKNMSMNQFKIRDSTITFRSSSKGASLEGTTTDYLSLDEYEHVSAQAEYSALESMSSSDYQIIRRWSTPSVAGYGIAKKYDESDQRKWVVKCTHCGYEQVLDFEKNIKLVDKDGIDIASKVILPGTYQYVCQKCGKLLDRWYNGHWETMSPGAGKPHGYKFSQLDAVWISADKIKEKELNSASKAAFYNYTLGETYTDSSNSFMESDVYDHLDLDGKPFDRSDYSLVSTGIDWGQHWNHVVTMGVHKDNHRVDLIGLRRVRTVTDVEHLNQDINEVMEEIRKYNPDIILPDNGYSGNNNLILLKEFGAKKVFSVIVKSATSSGDIVAHFSESNHTVTIDKVMQNMLMLSNMRRGDIHFWRPVDVDEKLFVEHWSNAIIRTEEQEVKGTTQLKYTKHYIRKGDDHYAQSSVYAMMGINELTSRASANNQNKMLVSTLEDSITRDEPTDIVKEFTL